MTRSRLICRTTCCGSQSRAPEIRTLLTGVRPFPVAATPVRAMRPLLLIALGALTCCLRGRTHSVVLPDATEFASVA